MRVEDIRFTLKDGREAVIRCPREEDIQGVLDYLYKSAGETEFIIRYPEECTKYTYEGEKELFSYWNESPYELSLVCEVDGKIAGNCNLSFGKGMKTKHIGSVAIALCREYWNLGIGSRMFEEMIRVSSEREGLHHLELEFIEGNSRARALYEKYGFRIAGVRPDAFMFRDGSLHAEYIMIKPMK